MASSTRPRNKLEQKVEKLLDRYIPHSYLQNISVFRPDKGILPEGMANEIDFLVHLFMGDTHTLCIIECKDCDIHGQNGKGLPKDKEEWFAHYDRRKPIKQQVINQWKALNHNIEPLSEQSRLKLESIIVTTKLPAGTMLLDERNTGPSFALLHIDKFRELILNWPKPLRVSQSELLRRLRCGQTLPALGHPEIRNAITYSRRCRKSIDTELFEHFKPTPRHWAINGSAGMGKSVLLAYSLQVFITDMYVVSRKGGFRDLNSFEDRAKEIQLPPIEKRQVWAVAMSEKQRHTLEATHDSMKSLYKEINPYSHYQRVSPHIKLWSEVEDQLDDQCNILLIDEAHDLSLPAQQKIKKWWEEKETNYLVVACDRHQKLRLISKSSVIIDGFDFRGHTSRLRRNYRNPAPCYFASISLLFRWFGDNGSKILPSKQDLQEGLGFIKAKLPDEASLQLILETRNDAHPANNWNYLVSIFPNPLSAFQQLNEARLGKDDVLWVRFDEESPAFNYEDLSTFTYHNLNTEDASDTIDKYIKGQEFPVVIIEGLPDDFEHKNGKEERDMWIARRLVYLVASRATVFIYYVQSGRETDSMLRELGLIEKPDSIDEASGTTWKLKIDFPPRIKKLSLGRYLDLIDEPLRAFENTNKGVTVQERKEAPPDVGSIEISKTGKVDTETQPQGFAKESFDSKRKPKGVPNQNISKKGNSKGSNVPPTKKLEKTQTPEPRQPDTINPEKREASNKDVLIEVIINKRTSSALKTVVECLKKFGLRKMPGSKEADIAYSRLILSRDANNDIKDPLLVSDLKNALDAYDRAYDAVVIKQLPLIKEIHGLPKLEPSDIHATKRAINYFKKELEKSQSQQKQSEKLTGKGQTQPPKDAPKKSHSSETRSPGEIVAVKTPATVTSLCRDLGISRSRMGIILRSLGLQPKENEAIDENVIMGICEICKVTPIFI
jgi:hypothetical protein